MLLIRERICPLNSIMSLWQDTNKQVKATILDACIFPVGTSKCESCTIWQSVKKKIGAFEIKYYRKVVKIPWTRMVKDADVLGLNIGETLLVDSIMRP